ncbi:MAG: hypothetical protein ACTSRU_01840 [Candidatus Hodarchaeales archaeon]
MGKRKRLPKSSIANWVSAFSFDSDIQERIKNRGYVTKKEQNFFHARTQHSLNLAQMTDINAEIRRRKALGFTNDVPRLKKHLAETKSLYERDKVRFNKLFGEFYNRRPRKSGSAYQRRKLRGK